jgi:GT2 family glycosyltransferase
MTTGATDGATNGGGARATNDSGARATVIVTQRERFGMTEESLESLLAHTPGAEVIYVDGNSPPRVAEYLRREAEKRGFRLIRKERFLTPNQARNIGVAAATTDYVAFVDNDVIYTPGWLDKLVEAADETGAWVVAPLTCQGLPFHTEIHHAGGDYAEDGDMDLFVSQVPEGGRRFNEVMHGHGEKLEAWAGRLERQETGMCEFHCVLARRDVFDRIGPLDEKLLSTKEHIDFSMLVRQAGGRVIFEPASVVTYVFPCRARPLNREDWPFFSLRWSDEYGRRSLEHFIAKWNLKTKPTYVQEKKGIYAMRRMQGILVPLMRQMPLLGKNETFARKAARASMAIEGLVNARHVARHDRQQAG